ncbi:hypothetical protein K2Q08_01045 [Patescibacteria group bacterium]|nr:hypothetical protein [Patescibacteria group bacterium]
MNMQSALTARLGEGATVMTTAEVQTHLGGTGAHSASSSGGAQERGTDPSNELSFHPTLG